MGQMDFLEPLFLIKREHMRAGEHSTSCPLKNVSIYANGNDRWSTYECPERVVDEWKTPKAESMSEVRRISLPQISNVLTFGLSLQVVRRQKDWTFPVSEIISAVEQHDFPPYVFPIHEVENLKHWHTNRVVLIGDAAHGKLAPKSQEYRELKNL